MKDIFGLILAVVILFGGCSQEEAPAPEGEEAHRVTLNGTVVEMQDAAQPVLEKLGEAVNVQQIPSCAFDGVETTYFYGSFYLTTYPGEAGEVIASVWFVDDSLATGEGVRIGDSREAVEDTYPGLTVSGDNAVEILRGNTKLVILLTEDRVSSIQYQLQME